MYKTALAAAIAAGLVYYLSLTLDIPLDTLRSLNLTTHFAAQFQNTLKTEDTMAVQSISRRVVQKVLAVETAEVRRDGVLFCVGGSCFACRAPARAFAGRLEA